MTHLSTRPIPPGAISTQALRSITMNALQRLIRARMTELDLTYDEVAKRGGLPKATIHALATKAQHRAMPKPDTLANLATGLGVSVDVVRSAAADAAGYAYQDIQVHGSLVSAENIRVVAMAMQELDEADQAHIRRIAMGFLEAKNNRTPAG